MGAGFEGVGRRGAQRVRHIIAVATREAVGLGYCGRGLLASLDFIASIIDVYACDLTFLQGDPSGEISQNNIQFKNGATATSWQRIQRTHTH